MKYSGIDLHSNNSVWCLRFNWSELKVLRAAFHRNALRYLVILVPVSFEVSGATLGNRIIYKRLSRHLGGAVNHSWHGNDATLFRCHYVVPFSPQRADQLDTTRMGGVHIHLANPVSVGNYRTADVRAEVDLVRLYDSFGPFADPVHIGGAGIPGHQNACR